MKAKKEWEQHIGVDPEICFGRPFLKSSGVPIWAILSMLAVGVPVEQVKEEYRVNDEEMQAIFAWAADKARKKRTIPKQTKHRKQVAVPL